MGDWFVVNVADARAVQSERSGRVVLFEDENDPFPEVGINIHVLEPGQPNGKYHGEEGQEDFLVLCGECILVIEGEERRLRAWDFVHCPPWTEHIFIGAGDGPCAILMVGGRTSQNRIRYRVNELAARHGASVEQDTDNPREAYADWPRNFKEIRMPWPLG